MKIEGEIWIDASPNKCWGLLSDLEKIPEWAEFTHEMTYISSGEVGKGTIYRERAKVGPSESESEWEITEWQPPKTQVHQGDIGIAKPEMRLSLRPSNGGTLLRQEVDVVVLPSVRPIGWLLEKLVFGRVMNSGMRETLKNAKSFVERRSIGD